MCFGGGVAGPAGQLLQGARCAHVAELMEIGFSVLPFQVFEVHTAGIDTHRSARLHTAYSDAMTGNTLAETIDSRFCTSASGNPDLAHVHQTIEKSACRNNDTLCVERSSPHRFHANGLAVFH